MFDTMTEKVTLGPRALSYLLPHMYLKHASELPTYGVGTLVPSSLPITWSIPHNPQTMVYPPDFFTAGTSSLGSRVIYIPDSA